MQPFRRLGDILDVERDQLGTPEAAGKAQQKDVGGGDGQAIAKLQRAFGVGSRRDADQQEGNCEHPVIMFCFASDREFQRIEFSEPTGSSMSTYNRSKA
jgi:hypothetical protein